jgi:hypothetical protein
MRRRHGSWRVPGDKLSCCADCGSRPRKLIAKGVYPITARSSGRKAAEPVPIFEHIAQLVIGDAQRKSASARVRYQWARHLGTAYCGPLLARTAHQITTVDNAEVLRPV